MLTVRRWTASKLLVSGKWDCMCSLLRPLTQSATFYSLDRSTSWPPDLARRFHSVQTSINFQLGRCRPCTRHLRATRFCENRWFLVTSCVDCRWWVPMVTCVIFVFVCYFKYNFWTYLTQPSIKTYLNLQLLIDDLGTSELQKRAKHKGQIIKCYDVRRFL